MSHRSRDTLFTAPIHARVHHRIARIVMATLVATLAACTTTDPNPDGLDTASAGKTDGARRRTTSARCFLSYGSDHCDAGLCPSIIVDQVSPVVDGYPTFVAALGAPSLPYAGTAAASPQALSSGGSSKTNGYYTLGIHDNAGGSLSISSEAEVSLSRLAANGYVDAGDLRAKVSYFEYQGQSYNNLELLCYLTAN